MAHVGRVLWGPRPLRVQAYPCFKARIVVGLQECTEWMGACRVYLGFRVWATIFCVCCMLGSVSIVRAARLRNSSGPSDQLLGARNLYELQGGVAPVT